EKDGYGPHIRDIARWEHTDNMLRDIHLIADGWTVIHLSYDIVMHHSRKDQQLLRQIVWGREGNLSDINYTPTEREAIRFGKRKGGSVYPIELSNYLGLSTVSTRRL